MDTAEEIANQTTQGKNHTEVKPEFTNGDAEQLYGSCVDIQRLALTLHMEIQLSKLIKKLKDWIEPITDGKKKFAKELGFILQGNSFLPSGTGSPEERERKLIDLKDELEKVNKSAFENWDELKKMLPMPLFTEEKFKEYKFLEGMDKQYFLIYCIKHDEEKK